MNSTRRILRPAAVLPAAALTGCTSTAGSTPTASAPTPASPVTTPNAPSPAPSTASTPSTPTSPQTHALDAYRAMWAAWVDAALTSDPTAQAIGRHTAGDALELILTSLSQDKREGMVTRGRPVLNPRVQSATPPTAPTHITVTDCADTTTWLKYRASDGSLKDNVPGGRHAITAVVQNVSGTWMVVRFLVQPVGTC